ncbi:hypothetical protein L1887_11627 [Cichorium endivia]|nr:hypothetical protein L1887_11627 [Cichorium endivia]
MTHLPGKDNSSVRDDELQMGEYMPMIVFGSDPKGKQIVILEEISYEEGYNRSRRRGDNVNRDTTRQDEGVIMSIWVQHIKKKGLITPIRVQHIKMKGLSKSIRIQQIKKNGVIMSIGQSENETMFDNHGEDDEELVDEEINLQEVEVDMIDFTHQS